VSKKKNKNQKINQKNPLVVHDTILDNFAFPDHSPGTLHCRISLPSVLAVVWPQTVPMAQVQQHAGLSLSARLTRLCPQKYGPDG